MARAPHPGVRELPVRHWQGEPDIRLRRETVRHRWDLLDKLYKTHTTGQIRDRDVCYTNCIKLIPRDKREREAGMDVRQII